MSDPKRSAGDRAQPLWAASAVCVLAAVAAVDAHGQEPPPADTLNLGTTSITGSQELPKVLYIVPWKRSDLGEIAGRPVNTLLEEVLAPIDPDVFERHVDYYAVLHPQPAEPSADASARRDAQPQED